MIFRQQFDLLVSKELKPDHFRGRATEPFKPWQRKLKAFCNSKRTSIRAALEWAETQPTEILDIDQVPWDHAGAAAAKLQDFLFQMLDENALLLVDKPVKALGEQAEIQYRRVDATLVLLAVNNTNVRRLWISPGLAAFARLSL